jgi:hypothetical protein
VPARRPHTVRYRGKLFFGCYADPDALPDVDEPPALLETETRALAEPGRRPAPDRARTEAGGVATV